MPNTIDLDTSLPLSEDEEEDFLEYYNRMVKILQIERAVLEFRSYKRTELIKTILKPIFKPGTNKF